jgi:hypothetical protein
VAQDVGFRPAGDLVAELEVDQDVLDVGREAVEVGLEVVLELLLGGAGLQVTQQERRGVVERLPGCGTQRVVLVGDLLAIEGGLHVQHGLLRGLQHGIETAQHGHGQDHIAILAADINVAQHVVRDVPDEVGDGVQLRLVHIRSRLRMRSAVFESRLLLLAGVGAVGGLAARQRRPLRQTRTGPRASGSFRRLLGRGRRVAVQESIEDRPATTCARNAQGDAHGLAVLLRKRIGQVRGRCATRAGERPPHRIRAAAIGS